MLRFYQKGDLVNKSFINLILLLIGVRILSEEKLKKKKKLFEKTLTYRKSDIIYEGFQTYEVFERGSRI